MDKVKQHWENWANTYGQSLRATTKASTAKTLEINALLRAFSGYNYSVENKYNILEIGCGNGYNCLNLAGIYKNSHFYGVDYVKGMVEAAVENAKENSTANTTFMEGDVRLLNKLELLPEYDCIFTVRCLINLEDTISQQQAITAISEKIRSGGHYFMIENSTKTYENQNLCRTALGLAPRNPAEFNHFIEENEILPHAKKAGLHLCDINDFSSLHDIVLYALLPSINGGHIDYDHELVKQAMELSINYPQNNAFGEFGQNRLFIFEKK